MDFSWKNISIAQRSENTTDFLGKTMRIETLLRLPTCGTQKTDNGVYFALLELSKKTNAIRKTKTPLIQHAQAPQNPR